MTSFLKGAGVALVTPFLPNGEIDFDALGALIEYQIEGGMDYLVSLGTTGETATLSKEEKLKVWNFTVEKVAGRIPLVAGIGGNNTQEIIEILKNVDLSGFSAILSVSPYYNKPTQEGIYQHYKALAENSKLPIILYNVPGRTGSTISAETSLRLAHDFKNIVAIKEASANFDIFNAILKSKTEDFVLISGDDPLTLPMMSIGAVGVISVIGNAFPKHVKDLVHLTHANKIQEARKIHLQLLEITHLCFADGNPAGIKNILSKKGILQPFVRLPLVEVGENVNAKIDEELKLMSSY